MSLNLSDANDRSPYCEWLTKKHAKDRLRSAATRGELRTNIYYPEDNTMNDDFISPEVPNPYEAAIKQLRAAASTPMSTFEDTWKATRLRELDAEHAAMDATPEPPRLTAASDADEDYSAPETYAVADLAALRPATPRRRRRLSDEHISGRRGAFCGRWCAVIISTCVRGCRQPARRALNQRLFS